MCEIPDYIKTYLNFIIEKIISGDKEFEALKLTGKDVALPHGFYGIKQYKDGGEYTLKYITSYEYEYIQNEIRKIKIKNILE